MQNIVASLGIKILLLTGKDFKKFLKKTIKMLDFNG
jgi:hypothetical protein